MEPLIIRELDGQKREIVLSGPALPDRGSFEVGGRGRVVRTYYPGRSLPTVQVLGVEESDIPVRGQLRDHWMGEGWSEATTQLMDSFWRKQSWCELVWTELRRKGRIIELKLMPLRAGEYGYELVFQVDEADVDEVQVQPDPAPETAMTLALELADAEAKASDLINRAAALNNVIRSIGWI